MVNGIELGKRKDKQYANKEELVPDLQDSINKALDSPKFMVAIWRIDEDDVLNYGGKFCWQFPHGDYLTAASMLMSDMRGNLEEHAEAPKPLKAAPFLANIKGPDEVSEVTEINPESEESQ